MTFKLKRMQRVLKWIAFVVLVPALTAALFSIGSYASTTKEFVDGKFEYTTSISYKASMKRSRLYPEGGIVSPEGSLIARITNSVLFSVETAVTADAPVKLEGSGRCLIRITSEDLWERDFMASAEQPIQTESAMAVPFSVKMSLQIPDLDNYIKQIEDETGVMQDRYIITLVPELSGTVTCLDKEYPLEPVPAVKFSYSGGLIQPVMEMDANSQAAPGFPKVYTKTITVTHKETMVNTLWGTALTVAAARLIFIPLSLALAAFLLWRLVLRALAAQANLSPAEKINRKYRSRLIQVLDRPQFPGKDVVEFQTCQELVRMADQKELPVLCHDGGDGYTTYFLLDAAAVYCCKASNKPADTSKETFRRPVAGKGGAADAT